MSSLRDESPPSASAAISGNGDDLTRARVCFSRDYARHLEARTDR
jgi:hypothetical protein